MPLRTLIAALPVMLCAWPVAAQVTVTRGADLSVDVASDGRTAIDLQGELWIVPASGGDARQVTHDLKTAQRPRWSPDRKRLAYQAVIGGRRGLWIHDLERNESESISGTALFDMHPAWHPDGQKISYASDVDGTGFDIWEVDVPTGVRWRVTFRPGDETEPAWSANGRDLVYVHRDGQQWSLVLRRHAQAEEVLLRSTEKLSAPSWRPDGSLITFFRGQGIGATLDMVILSSPRLVRTLVEHEQFVTTPVSWLDRQQMFYAANGQIRKRRFDDWRSKAVRFRATLQPRIDASVARERPAFPWLDASSGRLIIHAARLFDGVSSGYRTEQDILIEGGRILSVENHREHPGTIVIDMGDLTILPGFVDANARLPGQLSASHGPDLLTMGVTTLVASHSNIDPLNSLWAGSDIPGPRLLAIDQWSTATLPRPEIDKTGAVITSSATGLPAGHALAAQFRAMQIAGLTPEQTLRAVGVNAAAAILADPFIGRIATGAAADLVFVDGDPLAKIEDALNVVAVVRNGRFYSVSGLFDRAKSADSVE